MNRNSHPGFSLLELIVVLILVALVAVTVILQWSGVQHEAVLESTVSRLTFIDQHMRTFARSHRKTCALTLDLQKSRLRKLYHEKARDNPSWESLGHRVQLKKLHVAGKTQQRQIDLAFYQDGTSVTYALHLKAPGKREVWLLFAGISGQMTRFTTAAEFQDAWKILSASSTVAARL